MRRTHAFYRCDWVTHVKRKAFRSHVLDLVRWQNVFGLNEVVISALSTETMHLDLPGGSWFRSVISFLFVCFFITFLFFFLIRFHHTFVCGYTFTRHITWCYHYWLTDMRKTCHFLADRHATTLVVWKPCPHSIDSKFIKTNAHEMQNLQDKDA